MIQERSDQTAEIILEQIRSFGLAYQEEKQCVSLFEAPIRFAKDPRLEQDRFMQALFEQDIMVYPGIVLDWEKQKVLFIRMHFYKWKIVKVKQIVLAEQSISKGQIDQLLEWDAQRMDLNDMIVTVNMGLVLAMARLVNYQGVEYHELISNGSMALMRAVNRFDYTHGYKFSTYACRIIRRTMSGTIIRWYRYKKKISQLEPDWGKGHCCGCYDRQEIDETIEEINVILDNNLAHLNQIEMKVMCLRFPLQNERERKTLQEVGELLGLSKERIRQIQCNSLQKLRMTMLQRQ